VNFNNRAIVLTIHGKFDELNGLFLSCTDMEKARSGSVQISNEAKKFKIKTGHGVKFYLFRDCCVQE